MALSGPARTQRPLPGSGGLRLYIVVALLLLVHVVDAQSTGTDWITATIDGQTVSWLNNYSPTSVPYTPSLLASSFFDPGTTTSSTASAALSSSQALQTSIASTSQESSPTSSRSTANTVDSSTDAGTPSAAAALSSSLTSSTSPASTGTSGAESVAGVQSQSKTRHNHHKTAIIVGVVVGVLALVVLVILLFWFRRRWRRRHPSGRAPAYGGVDDEKMRPQMYKRESEMPMLASHNSAMAQAPYVPTIMVTRDPGEDHSSQHSYDEGGKPTAAASESSYEGMTRENSTRLPPKDLTPTMSRPHPLRSSAVPQPKPDFERLHSYQSITNGNPFGERDLGARSTGNQAGEWISDSYTSSTAVSAKRFDVTEGSAPESSSDVRHNWLGELRSPSPLCLTESIGADLQEPDSSRDGDTTSPNPATAVEYAPTAGPWRSDMPAEEAARGQHMPNAVDDLEDGGPAFSAQPTMSKSGYSQTSETTGLLAERPRFVPGVHQISREEQYRQNRAARKSIETGSPDGTNIAPEPPSQESPAVPPRTWRRSQPTHYLTQQEALTFDFGGQHVQNNRINRRSLPVHEFDQDGEFGYLHGQRVRMYEGA